MGPWDQINQKNFESYTFVKRIKKFYLLSRLNPMFGKVIPDIFYKPFLIACLSMVRGAKKQTIHFNVLGALNFGCLDKNKETQLKIQLKQRMRTV